MQSPSDSEMRRISTEGPRTPVGDHFLLREFQCNDGTDILLLHPVLTHWLGRMREQLGPLRVTSGFRTHAYNREIGGADQSKHLLGMAADIVPMQAPLANAVSFAQRHGFGGIGKYANFLHVDVYGKDRRW